jgi:hypothetical protein
MSSVGYSLIMTIITNLIGLVWFMVFNATFNNISVISWLSVLLVEETGVSGENHRQVTTHRHEQDSNSQPLFAYAIINQTTMRP